VISKHVQKKTQKPVNIEAYDGLLSAWSLSLRRRDVYQHGLSMP